MHDDLNIGRQSLTNAMTGEVISSISPDDIEFYDILGRGAAGYVQRGIYKTKGLPLAIKVILCQ